MFEAFAAFLVVLSVGILVAHALDAFRGWQPPTGQIARDGLRLRGKFHLSSSSQR
jgi:hypothetical protein